MENEYVFEAVVNADQRPRHHISKSKSSGCLNMGHDGAIAAGGIDISFVDEDTPLLSRDEIISPGPSYSSEREEDTSRQGSSTNVFAALPWRKRPSVRPPIKKGLGLKHLLMVLQIFWLIPSMLVHTLAFGGLMVPKLTLILQLICKDYLANQALSNLNSTIGATTFNNENNPQCKDARVQELVSSFQIGIQLAVAIPSILVAPKLGSLSDRYGRVKILAFTSIGILVSEGVTILTAKYPEMFSVNWILVGSFVDGLCGTFITQMAIISAYAADCYPPSRRAIVFGWIHGCLFTGVALGPFAAALIIKLTGNILRVFYVALGVHALFLPYILFFVPESVTDDRQFTARRRTQNVGNEARNTATQPQQPWSDKLLSVVIRGGGLLTPLSILWPTGPGTSNALRRNLVVLASVDGVVFGVAMGSVSVVVYYLGYMFDWDTAKSSIFIAVISTCRVLILLIVLPIITRLVQGRRDLVHNPPNPGFTRLDVALIRVSILFDTLGFVGYAMAVNGDMFLASGCVAAIGAMASPTLQSSLTKHVPSDRTGQLLGAIGLIHGFARAIAPVIFNLIYAGTVGYFPQAVFVCLASTFGLAGVLSFFLRPHVYLESKLQDASKVPLQMKNESAQLAMAL